LHLRNTSQGPITVEINDNSYHARPLTRTLGANQTTATILHLTQSHGWYDYTVKATGSDAEARFAGRVENGQASFSDPVIGGTAQDAPRYRSLNG